MHFITRKARALKKSFFKNLNTCYYVTEKFVKRNLFFLNKKA